MILRTVGIRKIKNMKIVRNDENQDFFLICYTLTFFSDFACFQQKKILSPIWLKIIFRTAKNHRKGFPKFQQEI